MRFPAAEPGEPCTASPAAPAEPAREGSDPAERGCGRSGAAAHVLGLSGLCPAHPWQRGNQRRARLQRALMAAISFVSFPCSLLRLPLCRCTSAPVFPCLNVSPPLPSAPVSLQTTARRPKVSTAAAVVSPHLAGCCVVSQHRLAPGGARRVHALLRSGSESRGDVLGQGEACRGNGAVPEPCPACCVAVLAVGWLGTAPCPRCHRSSRCAAVSAGLGSSESRQAGLCQPAQPLVLHSHHGVNALQGERHVLG